MGNASGPCSTTHVGVLTRDDELLPLAEEDHIPPLPQHEPSAPPASIKRVQVDDLFMQTTADQDDFEKNNPFNKPHKCTDVCCTLVFAVCLAGVGYALNYAQTHGDMRKLTHGMDWKGDLCGVSEAVKDQPYLYWCTQGGPPLSLQALKDNGIPTSILVGGQNVTLTGVAAVLALSGSFDLEHPICVEQCPVDSTTKHACYQKAVEKYSEQMVNGSFVKIIDYVFGFVQDYASHSSGGFYCMPKKSVLFDQIKEQLNGSMEGWIVKLVQLRSAWQPLVLSAVLAVLLGYAYLITARCLATCIIWVTVSLAICVPLGAGIYVIACVFRQDAFQLLDQELSQHKNITLSAYLAKYNATTDQISQYAVTTGDRRVDLAIGALLNGVGILIIFAACTLKRKVAMVIGALQATCDCVFGMPGMLLFPLTAAIPRVLYASLAMTGIGWFLTVGTVQKYSVSSAIGGQLATYVPEGLARQFTLSEDEQMLLAFLTFMCVWGLEFVQALDQFVFAYAAQRWYFQDYDSSGHKWVNQFVFFRGYFLGLLYHLGSLAMGSFLLAVFRVIYYLLAFLYKRAQDATSDQKAQAVIKVIASCFCCCLKLFEKFLRFVNRSAYLIVGLESRAFCDAAEDALNLALSEAPAIGFLQGATKVFQVGGLVTITSGGAVITWLLCVNVPSWKSSDSDYFVANPEVVATVAGFICFLVALCFTFVVDMVSDTLLLCYCLDKSSGQQADAIRRHLPKSLAALLGSGS